MVRSIVEPVDHLEVPTSYSQDMSEVLSYASCRECIANGRAHGSSRCIWSRWLPWRWYRPASQSCGMLRASPGCPCRGSLWANVREFPNSCNDNNMLKFLCEIEQKRRHVVGRCTRESEKRYSRCWMRDDTMKMRIIVVIIVCDMFTLGILLTSIFQWHERNSTLIFLITRMKKNMCAKRKTWRNIFLMCPSSTWRNLRRNSYFFGESIVLFVLAIRPSF